MAVALVADTTILVWYLQALPDKAPVSGSSDSSTTEGRQVVPAGNSGARTADRR